MQVNVALLQFKRLFMIFSQGLDWNECKFSLNFISFV